MELSNILSFLVSAVLLTLMPGPDILFVITQSISSGRKAAIIFVTGLCTGLVVHILALSLGLSLLISSSPKAFFVLKLLGAGYLIYLGIMAFLSRKRNKLRLSDDKAYQGKLYRKGILMNLLNPKVILFFVAFFPQFMAGGESSGWEIRYQVLILGLVFIIQAFVVFSSVAFLANKLIARFLKNEKVALWVNIAESIIYVAIGISVLFV